MKTHHAIAISGLIVIVTLDILSLCSCGNIEVQRPPSTPPLTPALTMTGKPIAPADVIPTLQKERSDLIGRVAAVTATIATEQSKADAAAREAKLAPIVALCQWASYIGVAAVIIGIGWAALIGIVGRWIPAIGIITRFVPLGWQAGLAIAAAGLAVAAVALTIGVIMPWLIKGVLIASGVALAAGLMWLVAHYQKALRLLWDRTQEEAADHPMLAKALANAGVDIPKKSQFDLVSMPITTTIK